VSGAKVTLSPPSFFAFRNCALQGSLDFGGITGGTAGLGGFGLRAGEARSGHKRRKRHKKQT